MMSIANIGKSRGRPPTGAIPTMVRLYADVAAAIDRWIADQPEKIGRPEAIRRILAEYLRAKRYLK